MFFYFFYFNHLCIHPCLRYGSFLNPFPSPPIEFADARYNLVLSEEGRETPLTSASEGGLSREPWHASGQLLRAPSSCSHHESINQESLFSSTLPVAELSPLTSKCSPSPVEWRGSHLASRRQELQYSNPPNFDITHT